MLPDVAGRSRPEAAIGLSRKQPFAGRRAATGAIVAPLSYELLVPPFSWLKEPQI